MAAPPENATIAGRSPLQIIREPGDEVLHPLGPGVEHFQPLFPGDERVAVGPHLLADLDKRIGPMTRLLTDPDIDVGAKKAISRQVGEMEVERERLQQVMSRLADQANDNTDRSDLRVMSKFSSQSASRWFFVTCRFGRLLAAR